MTKKCNTFGFLSLKVLKAKKEAVANTILLRQSRDMVGQFKKAYLHRPIKILHFLSPVRIQKCLTQLQNILTFLIINHLQENFLEVFSVCTIVPLFYLCVSFSCNTLYLPLTGLELTL